MRITTRQLPGAHRARDRARGEATARAAAAACPAWLRHALVVYAATAAGIALQAIVDAHGVTGVDWGAVALDALDTGAYTTATGLVLLVSTPLTRQYGVGSTTEAPPPLREEPSRDGAPQP